MLPKRQLQAMLSKIDLQDQDAVRAYAGAMADMEARQREAVRELYRAHGLADREPPATKDEAERIEELTALLDARLKGELADYWREYLAPDSLENVDAAEELRGLGPEEWREIVGGWAAAYRDQGAPDDTPDTKLTDHYVQQRFGVSLATFERNVVRIGDADVMQRAIEGPNERTRKATLALARHVTDDAGDE